MNEGTDEGPRRAQLAQDRSVERREAILAAAFDLFADHGRRGVTHRAVAARASVSVASVGYYFGSIDELVSVAVGHRIGAWLEELGTVTATAHEREWTVDELVGFVERLCLDTSPATLSQYCRTYLNATDDDALKSAMLDAMTLIEQLVVTMAESIGVDDAIAVAQQVELVVWGAFVRIPAGRRCPEAETAVATSAIRSIVRTGVTARRAHDRRSA